MANYFNLNIYNIIYNKLKFFIINQFLNILFFSKNEKIYLKIK